jgi:Ca2+-binding EF-hand superfamily protein
MKPAALLALLAATLATTALAQGPTRPAATRVFISPSGEPFRPGALGRDPFDAWFDRVDANHDGRIDRTKFRADAEAFFHKLDLNGDGVIDGFEIANYETNIAPELAASTEEHAVSSSPEGPAMLIADPEPVSSADLALNSRITLAEWLQAADRRFDLLDKKRQGFLTRVDLIALLPKGARPPGASGR